jgi:hypothetical protein
MTEAQIDELLEVVAVLVDAYYEHGKPLPGPIEDALADVAAAFEEIEIDDEEDDS